ncbi:MAG TPA: asparagine synthase (glutamine-hydrolyzing), partial [Gemmatimonadales bacterium]|nr:asparagine synthase (glutamine-hydrolyzing) [Gemmatimonadales bacterium]
MPVRGRHPGATLMCGIFGVVSLGQGSLRHPECLAAMARSLAHRGPDGERIVGHARAQIGARRLAIMDLTTGDQPFQSPDGDVWMVCNGEIYNAPALRREAEGWGYPFRSRGDIENIVPFYERLGPDVVARLDGMFGLALWDDRRGRLLLARDRAGEKPLFWTRVGNELRFASEVQALLVFPDQPRRLDRAAATNFAALGYVPGSRTMLQDIHKLAPGQRLVAEAGTITVQSYWSAAETARTTSRLTDAAQLREVLLAAVARELMADVPVGVFTSGGLDSSFLAAAATRVIPGERIHTYAARFAARGYDESPFAEAVTHDIRTVHHVVTCDDASLRTAFDTVTAHLAEPIGDPAALPTYLLAAAAREDVKVVLSGEGADELFGGYPTYLGHRVAAAYQRIPSLARSGLRWLANAWPASTGKVTWEFMVKQFVAGAERP